MPARLCREGLTHVMATPRASLFFGAVLVSMLALILPLLSLVDTQRIGIPFALAPAGLAAVFGGFATRFQPRLNWWRWRDYIAARGHCPSCGYALVNLPEERDGCRVCAECGGAWRIR